jgi:shikimate kinase / 3-dehydroquinate synthase
VSREVTRTFMPVPPLPDGRSLLVVTGFMGSGKTEVGRLAATLLDLPFIDLDEVVEKREGRSISQIFEQNGEGHFRRLEQQAIVDAARLSGAVIATGGGAPLHEAEFSSLARSATVVVLSADIPCREARLGTTTSRPKLTGAGIKSLTALLQERQPAYESAGELLDTSSLSLQEAAGRLVKKYRRSLHDHARVSIQPGRLGAYPVVIGHGAAQSLAEEVARRPQPSSVVVVFDPLLAQHAEAAVEGLSQLVRVTSVPMTGGEQSKTLTAVRALWSRFRDSGLDRSGIVIAIGGGALLDTAGFAAATYMRGVRLINVPTTLLAMADAGIGGKVGVNDGHLKNSVGAIHQPELVISDPRLLATLGPRELRCGIAEIVKVALLASPLLLEILERAPLDERGMPGHLDWAIEQAIRIKAAYVGSDPEDLGVRQSLNLGHTFAHAVEAASGYRTLHGEAVALGLVAAARLRFRLGDGDGVSEERLIKILDRFGLPVALESVSRGRLMSAMSGDKKWRGGEPTFVVTAPGGAELVQNVPLEVAAKALAPIEQPVSQSEVSVMPLRILVVHGPNLNMLGTREPDIYGATTLEEIDDALERRAEELTVEIRFLQSNIEGELVQAIQKAAGWADGIVINPGGYSHTSVAIRDAVAAVGLPTIEVHITNPAAREHFRNAAVVASACQGMVSGFGWRGYVMALEALAAELRREWKRDKVGS